MDKVLPLPDEYFLLAHHDFTGRAHLNSRVLRTGLSAAILAELVLTGRIAIDDDRIALRDPHLRDDPVTDAVVEHIDAHDGAHPVRAWIEYVRDHIQPHELVARRLVQQSLLQPARHGLVNKSVRYPARDPLATAQPRVRLRSAAERPAQPCDPRTCTLASLAQTTGLDEVIADGANRSVRDGLPALAMQVPRDLRSLISGLNAAVTMIALSISRA